MRCCAAFPNKFRKTCHFSGQKQTLQDSCSVRQVSLLTGSDFYATEKTVADLDLFFNDAQRLAYMKSSGENT
jgi:hypothetical protein